VFPNVNSIPENANKNAITYIPTFILLIKKETRINKKIALKNI